MHPLAQHLKGILHVSRTLRIFLLLALLGSFSVAILLGFNSEYEKVKTLVRILCLSCVGLE